MEAAMKTRLVSRAELREAYETLTVSEAAKKMDVSVVQLYRMLDAAGIPLKTRRVVFEIVD